MNGCTSAAGTADALHYFWIVALDLDAMFRK